MAHRLLPIDNAICCKLAVTVGGKNIHELCCLSVEESLAFFDALTLSDPERPIAAQIDKELRPR
ncbi:hypothetical protein, partial [Treponema endosymbiont of Eucomonympha sp.]|uniref:hypothetical protein n=1 Tax=Treponema endosymbiont of Eucomonympha sp. TaxID=1580831 RepID=UPI001396A49E